MKHCSNSKLCFTSQAGRTAKSAEPLSGDDYTTGTGSHSDCPAMTGPANFQQEWYHVHQFLPKNYGSKVRMQVEVLLVVVQAQVIEARVIVAVVIVVPTTKFFNRHNKV